MLGSCNAWGDFFIASQRLEVCTMVRKGPLFYSLVGQKSIKLSFIQPGKPNQSANVEHFNKKRKNRSIKYLAVSFA